jgi:hypothetical protein
MKLLLIRCFSALLFTGLLFTLESCQKSKSELNSIYSPNKEFLFTSKLSGSLKLDTILLQTLNRNSADGRKMIKWIYLTKDSIMGRNSFSETGITNESNEISLAFPSQSYLKITSLTMSPMISLPLNPKYSKDFTIDYIKSDDGLQGKSTKVDMKISGKTFYSNGSIKDSCWVIKTIARNPKGIVTSKYYFSEKYGFVYLFWESKSLKYSVEMKLVKTKKI